MRRSLKVGFLVCFGIAVPVLAIGISLGWSDGALGAATIIICGIGSLAAAAVLAEEYEDERPSSAGRSSR